MACESGVWAEVIEIMHGASKDKVIVNPKRRIGYYLPLQCEKHDRRIFMQEPEDWSFTQGLCTSPFHSCVLTTKQVDVTSVVVVKYRVVISALTIVIHSRTIK